MGDFLLLVVVVGDSYFDVVVVGYFNCLFWYFGFGLCVCVG